MRIERKGAPAIAGWYRRVGDAECAVLLAHGLRADRRQMLGRAEFLIAAGYSVLLIDLQAHGESLGKHIGFGLIEASDIVDAVKYLKEDHSSVGVIGISLGGAAAVLAADKLDADALVVEAVFTDIRKATANRLQTRLGGVGSALSSALLWQLEPRTGIPVSAVAPIEAVADVRAPLLVIAGEADRRTTLADSQALFDRANQPKAFWAVPGAAHENYHVHSQVEYERRVLNFFSQYLVGCEVAP